MKAVQSVCAKVRDKYYQWDADDAHFKMYTSILRIWVQCIPTPSKRDEALLSMKLSVRGSIRKPPNLIAFMAIVVELWGSGDTDSAGPPCILAQLVAAKGLGFLRTN